MSFNLWNYGYGNPVKYMDPSGFKPCTETQWQEKHRYCKLNRGGYLDVDHFKEQKIMADGVRNGNLRAQFGRPVSSFVLQGHLGYQVKDWDWGWYSATFYTQLPVDSDRILGDPLLDRITLGIMLSYDYGFETAQMKFPNCYSLIGLLKHCSAFSNEDLPSNYLGILLAVKPEITFDFILKELGGGEQVEFEGDDGFPTEEYWGNTSWPWLEPVFCRLGLCSATTPFNDQCNFKIYDADTGKFEFQPWPQSLLLQPFGEHIYWSRNPNDFEDTRVP